MKILKTTTRFDEPAKGFLAKATSTAPNNKQIVFVLIHQKIGFVNAKLHHIRNTNFRITQKKEMGNMRSVGT
ncbi:MAG: hypothetical protein H0U27_03320 [Nitrosopumilus sp.]|nr:hypothetical protein [Nitrosopumilus sp.]